VSSARTAAGTTEGMSLRFVGLLLVVLAGCGGGEPETPDGYATYDGKRAAFAYPRDWQATTTKDDVIVRPPGAAEDAPGPAIQFQDFTLDQDFDDFVEQSDSVLETLIASRDGKRSDYDADPAGADEAVAREVDVKGTDGRPYRTVSVTARVGERVLSLSVSGRPEDKLDIDGVIASLRLKS
jgi:hypothetical protein